MQLSDLGYMGLAVVGLISLLSLSVWSHHRPIRTITSVWSDSIRTNPCMEIETVCLAVGISFLSRLEADIA